MDYTEVRSYVSRKIVLIGSNATKQLCEYNERRIAIVIIGNGNSALVGPGFDTIDPAFGTIFHGQNPPQAAPVIYTRALHGALAQSDWWAVTGAATDEISVWEVLTE